MKKTIHTFIATIIASLLLVSSAFANGVTVEYKNDQKLLELRGTIEGNYDDSVVAVIYNYDPASKGVGSDSAPRFADAFFLGRGGSVDYDLMLPPGLAGGKYVLRITQSDGYVDKIFMHVNDALAPSSLAQINSATQADFASALAAYGPGCGLDPDVYEAYKGSIAPILYVYKGTGFADVNSFMTLSTQAVAASKIKSDGEIADVLRDHGAYLVHTDAGNNLIDCAADYAAQSDGVRAVFDAKIKGVDFAQSKGFCRVFREALILSEFEHASAWTEVKDAILGTRDNAVVNNNFKILAPDTTDYDKLIYPDEVFAAVYKQKSQVTSFDDIVSVFESCAEAQYQAETAEKEAVTNPGTPSYPSSPSGGGGVSISGAPAVTPDVISGAATGVTLTDIGGHWAEDTINILVRNKVLTGYEDGSFRPENSVTRSEFVAIMVKAFDIDAATDASFADVSPSHWAHDYILAACGAGVVTGYETGNFGVDDLITREQAATIIYRVISLSHTIPEGSSDFYDIGKISDWALRPVLDLAGEGLINGVGDNQFSPDIHTTRAQAAVLINNALEYLNVK